MNYSDNELAIYSILQDERSKLVFDARKSYTENRDTSVFYDVFEKPSEHERTVSIVKSKKYILYGYGAIARNAIPLLKHKGWLDNCIGIWDINPELQGTTVHGLEITPPLSPPTYIGDDVYVLSAVCIYGLNYKPVREYLYSIRIGEERIFDVCDIIENQKEQYFDRNIIIPRLSSKEIFIDGGCFNFQTSIELLQLNSDVEKIYAFEAAKEHIPFVERGIQVASNTNMSLYNMALWSHKDTLYFTFNGLASRISTTGQEVQGVAADDIIPNDEKVTFVKLDIEGAELEALKGMRRIIEKFKPKMAICIYHKPMDYIDLAEYILSIRSDYKLYMRHYSSLSLETILYAV